MGRSFLHRRLQEGFLLQTCRGSCWAILLSNSFVRRSEHVRCGSIDHSRSQSQSQSNLSHTCSHTKKGMVAWVTAAPVERHMTAERSFEECQESRRESHFSSSRWQFRSSSHEMNLGGTWLCCPGRTYWRDVFLLFLLFKEELLAEVCMWTRVTGYDDGSTPILLFTQKFQCCSAM